MSTHASGPARHEVSDDELLAVVREWLPGRRWFPAKDDDAAISSVGALTLVDPAGAAEIRILLVHVVSGTTDVVLQVPLALHRGRAREAGTGAGWIATVGVRREQPVLTWCATLGLTVFTTVQSFAVFAPIISGATLFLVLGVILLVSGYLFDRARRHLARALPPSPEVAP